MCSLLMGFHLRLCCRSALDIACLADLWRAESVLLSFWYTLWSWYSSEFSILLVCRFIEPGWVSTMSLCGLVHLSVLGRYRRMSEIDIFVSPTGISNLDMKKLNEITLVGNTGRFDYEIDFACSGRSNISRRTVDVLGTGFAEISLVPGSPGTKSTLSAQLHVPGFLRTGFPR